MSAIDWYSLCKQLNELSQALKIFHEGLKAIKNEQPNFEKSGEVLFCELEGRLQLIAKLLLNYNFPDNYSRYEMSKILSFCFTKLPENEILTNIQKSKVDASEKGDIIIEIIKKRNFSNPDLFLEIVKYGIEIEPSCRFLTKEGIKDFLTLDQYNEISKFMVQQKSFQVSEIAKLNIKDETLLCELIMFWSKNHNIYSFESAISDIKKLGVIKSEDWLKIVEYWITKTPKVIYQFNKIPLEVEDLFALTKLAINNNAEAIYPAMANIKFFGLSEEEFMDFTKFCLDKSPHDFVTCIDRKFLIDNLGENKLYEFAKLCCQHDAAGAKCILHFAFKEQDKLFKLAKLCAGVNAPVTLDYLHSFRLDDKQLLEIVKLCAQKDPLRTIRKLKTFNLAPHSLIEAIKTCLQFEPQETERWKLISWLYDVSNSLVECKKIWGYRDFINAMGDTDNVSPELIEDVLKRLCNDSGDIQNAHFEELVPLVENFMSSKDNQVKLQKLQWIINTVFTVQAFKDLKLLSDSHTRWLSDQNIMEAISDFAVPSFRSPLSVCALILSSTEQGRKIFPDLIPDKSKLASMSDTAKKKVNFQMLTAILLSSLINQGVDLKKLEDLRNEILAWFKCRLHLLSGRATQKV